MTHLCSEFPHDPDGFLASLPEPSFFHLLHSLVTSLRWFPPVYMWHVADSIPTSIVFLQSLKTMPWCGKQLRQWGLRCQEEGWLLDSDMTSRVCNLPLYIP